MLVGALPAPGPPWAAPGIGGGDEEEGPGFSRSQ